MTWVYESQKDGTTVEIPDDVEMGSEEFKQIVDNARQSTITQQADVPVIPRQDQPESSALKKGIIGVPELGVSMASSALAYPVAGLLGAAQAINPFAEEGAGARTVEAVQEAMTYQPRSEATVELVENIGNVVESVTPEFVESGIEYTQEKAGELQEWVLENYGPEVATVTHTLPTAAVEALKLGTIRRMRRIPEDAPSGTTEVLESGIRSDVPVLTTDVRPPDTWLGKWTQTMSEKLGPLGSGPARARQQEARVAAIQGLADEFDIELDSDFATTMIQSLNSKSARNMTRAGLMRNRAVSSLNEYGDVPMSQTLAQVERILAHQITLKEKSNQSLVKNLNDIKESIKSGNFENIKDIRTEVLSDIRQLLRSDDDRAKGALESVKMAMDKDMLDFARSNDRGAAADWVRSNRIFADGYNTIKNTEVKRILNKGDSTPEVVIPLLKGGKRSELLRLYDSLGADGRSAARAAILQDALKESGFFGGNINPDRFATAMSRWNRQQAVDIFFQGKEKDQLNGFVKLLNATRRAQQSTATPPTGAMNVPFVAGGGAAIGAQSFPLTTIIGGGTLAAWAKAYESKRIRDLLLRWDRVKAGSPAETGLIEASMPFISGATSAAAETQESEEQPRTGTGG